MNPTGRLPRNSANWLLDSQLAPYVDSFKHNLTERRYASSGTKMRRQRPAPVPTGAGVAAKLSITGLCALGS
jgi:hypothetical protein